MSGSTKQFRRKLIYVVPKDRVTKPEEIREAVDRLGREHPKCIEITASEEQYNIKFHGIYKEPT